MAPAPARPALTALVGPPGSGKTVALLERVAAAMRERPGVEARLLVTAPSAAGVERLRDRVPTALSLEACALQVLAAAKHSEPPSPAIEILDDYDAELLFERAIEPLLSLEWAELVSAEIDPEIAALRAPERFAAAAFRLIRKLREAQISPPDFLAAARRGATEFYANPPNFANPQLIVYTAERYRDSLAVDAKELARQHERELDLAKILARLYDSYLEVLVRRGCMTSADVLIEAARALAAGRVVSPWRAAFVDDAQDLGTGDLRFLQALFGNELRGVTFAGDPDQATGSFERPRAPRTFELAEETIVLGSSHRLGAGIANAARFVLEGPEGRTAMLPAPDSTVTLYRAATRAAEARYVAENVVRLCNAGAVPESIAVVVRSLRGVEPFVEALLDKNLEVAYSGDLPLYGMRDVQDGLAVLWSIVDPFRHDWLLRVLHSPLLRLSDATIALLCGEPVNAQPLLFELPGDEAEHRSRWDRRRDLRLGRNVTRGDRDGELSDEARERVVRFRALREGWQSRAPILTLPELARLAFREAGLCSLGGPRETARDRARRRSLDRLIERIEAYAKRYPSKPLDDFLSYAERLSEVSLDVRERAPGAVAVLSAAAAKGAEYEHVFACDLRAGAFPAYYAPDAFLFSPRQGMIAKENAGDARASRTAKFSWYAHRARLRESYNKEERRLLYCALTRAKRTLWLSASEPPTRGANTPEFLAELQTRRPAGSRDLSGAWQPEHPTLSRPAAAAWPAPPSPEPLPPAELPVLSVSDVVASSACGPCWAQARLLDALGLAPAALPSRSALPFRVRREHGILADAVVAVENSQRYGRILHFESGEDGAGARRAAFFSLAADEFDARDDLLIPIGPDGKPQEPVTADPQKAATELDAIFSNIRDGTLESNPACARCKETP